MTSLQNLTIGEEIKFREIMEKAGLTAEMVRRLIKEPALARPMISNLNPNNFLFSLSVSPEAQIGNMRRWNAERNWGLLEDDFASLGEAPIWPNDPMCAVVLVLFLETVQRTFEEWWEVAAAEQPDSWRWRALKSDPEHLRLLEGQVHTPGLRWALVDMGANKYATPAVVRDKNSLQAEGLAVAAHFPEYIRQMDGDSIPYLCLAGYQANLPHGNEEPWRHLPVLSWSLPSRTISLSAHWETLTDEEYAVPTHREL